MKIGIVWGGLCYNCSWDPLVIPPNRDLKTDCESYPGYEVAQKHTVDWLKETYGYRDPDDSEIEVYED